MNPSRSQPQWSGLNLVLFTLNLAIVLFLFLRFWTGWDRPHVPIGGDKTAVLHAAEQRGDLYADEKLSIDIFEKNSPRTVNITTYANRSDPSSFNILKIPQGTGTGFIWDTWKSDGQEYGRIVTNYHVIANARNPQSIQVTLADHSTWRVLDVNFAEDHDLAVLWTDAPKSRLKSIELGDSSKLKVGQKVYAIGNPFGLDQTLTTGIISALGREIRSDKSSVPLHGLIQTDASINPGNSGGPLLDSAGLLIGVNTAIVSPSGASAGIGFAIPVDDVNRTVTSLIRKEVELRAVMGIHPAADQILKRTGQKGVLIAGVVPDGPAAKAGLRGTLQDKDGIHLGDIIIAIDGKDIDSSRDLFATLDQCKVGQEIHVKVLRDDKELEFKVTLTGVGR